MNSTMRLASCWSSSTLALEAAVTGLPPQFRERASTQSETISTRLRPSYAASPTNFGPPSWTI